MDTVYLLSTYIDMIQVCLHGIQDIIFACGEYGYS